MKPELQEKVRSIAEEKLNLHGKEQNILNDEEVRNLTIPKAT